MVPVRVLAVLALAASLLAAGAARAQLHDISRLQAEFRKLGGTIAPIEGASGSDYRFEGRPPRYWEIVDLLRRLRDAHMMRATVGELDVGDVLSASAANRLGRDLLQLERNNYVSLLDTATRRRVNGALREFYDVEIDLAAAACATDCVDNMFRAAELSRARDFMGSVYRRGNLRARPDEERELARFEAVVAYREVIDAIENYAPPDGTVSRALSAVRRSLIARWGSIDAGFTTDASGAVKFDDPRSTDTGVGTASFMASLAPIGEALVVYHVTNLAAYAFVVVRNAPPRLVRLPGDAAGLRSRARLYHTQLSEGPGQRGFERPGSRPRSSWRDTGYELYRTLIAPVEPYFGRADRLVIVPHDLLHLVPFAALPTGRAAANDAFLIDRYSIAELPTPMFRGWNGMRRREPTRPALVVGIDEFATAPRLKYAEAEAVAVARILQEGDLALGSRGQATYQNVVGGLERYSIIHIASHGMYVPGAPGAAHVLLGGAAAAEDVPMTGVDVLGKRLNASLVVLSACRTATPSESGLPPDGDMLGLPRAFLIAGAAAVIATLWPVNDESAQKFFEDFYGGALGGLRITDPLLTGRDLDAELANTQRRMRKQYPDPHYWAPFILIGG